MNRQPDRGRRREQQGDAESQIHDFSPSVGRGEAQLFCSRDKFMYIYRPHHLHPVWLDRLDFIPTVKFSSFILLATNRQR